MPRSAQTEVIDALEKVLGLRFGPPSLNIRPWGSIDASFNVRHNRWLLVEVEAGQHHPNTNVLKLWPTLEATPELSILLIHAFCTDALARYSSRGNLALWLAARMKKDMGLRFSYLRVHVNRVTGAVDDALTLKVKVAQWRGQPPDNR